MAEWSNAPDSKSGIRLYRIVGSNPTLSAMHRGQTPLLGRFLFQGRILTQGSVATAAADREYDMAWITRVACLYSCS
jgi:hypothetical protein